MSAIPLNLTDISGYLVADNRGRVIGKVECPMYGTLPDVPDALSVKSGFLSRHRRLVPADTIAEVDRRSEVVALRVAREAIRRFLEPAALAPSASKPERKPARSALTRRRTNACRDGFSAATRTEGTIALSRF